MLDRISPASVSPYTFHCITITHRIFSTIAVDPSHSTILFLLYAPTSIISSSNFFCLIPQIILQSRIFCLGVAVGNYKDPDA